MLLGVEPGLYALEPRADDGWFRRGDGTDFTASVAADVTRRLLRGEGRPGAHTPGALFGPELAEAVGGEFILDHHVKNG